VVQEDATGTLVATAMARHRPDAEDYDFPYGGELSLLFTHPDHRRQGLGYAVTAAVLTRLMEVGYPNIYLTTMDGRLPALRLYLRMGWLPFLPDDLAEAKLEERWQKVCAELTYPFTPAQWPRTANNGQ
jgi:mycothiol synthase